MQREISNATEDEVGINFDEGPYGPIQNQTLSSVDLKLPEHQVTSINLKLPETYIEDIEDTDEASSQELEAAPTGLEKEETNLISAEDEYEEQSTEIGNKNDLAQESNDDEVGKTPEIQTPEASVVVDNGMDEAVEFHTSRTYDLTAEKSLLSVEQQEEEVGEMTLAVADTGDDKSVTEIQALSDYLYDNLTVFHFLFGERWTMMVIMTHLYIQTQLRIFKIYKKLEKQ